MYRCESLMQPIKHWETLVPVGVEPYSSELTRSSLSKHVECG